jgi:hypothetical protein
MKTQRQRQPLVFAIFIACATLGANGNTNDIAITIRTTLGTNSISISKVPSGILDALGRQDVFDQLTSTLLNSLFVNNQTTGTKQTNAFLQFINDWHVRPKVFQATSGSNNVSFGVEFDYNKSLAHHVLNENCDNPMGLSLNVSAKGDVAVDAKNNPNNLIEAGGSFHLFQGIGGIDPTFNATPEAQRVLLDAVNLEAKAATAGKRPIDDPAYQQLVKEFTAHMRPHFFYDLQAHGTLETDQQFQNKQWTYGGKLALVFRDWRAKSDVGYFNVFDYPFAMVRALLNKEDFQPSGRTFPSVLGGIDLVDPSQDSTRLAIDSNKDPYPRFRVEVAFKTPVMRTTSQTYYVSAAYRHFEEINAPAAIKSANLAHSDYFVIKVDLPYKFNLSYSTGKLPLDHKNDQVYAVGWNLNF